MSIGEIKERLYIDEERELKIFLTITGFNIDILE
jgi:hypothetical protein